MVVNCGPDCETDSSERREERRRSEHTVETRKLVSVWSEQTNREMSTLQLKYLI